MSAFSPLNLIEDVSALKKDLEEEHTRELEIQNAYKTYHEAISFQSQKRWREAYVKYKELATSSVVVNHFYEEVSFIKGLQNGRSNLQPDELSFIPQNVKKLRFLFFRNRGFLHFNILKEGRDTFSEILHTERLTEPDLASFVLEKDLFYTMLDGFVNCLLYDEADESLLRVLFDLYMFLGVQRLAKFTLEYCMSYPLESEDTNGIYCLNDWAQPKWEKYKTGWSHNEPEAKALNEKLSFLAHLKEDFVAQMTERMKFAQLKVLLKPNSSWLNVICSINHALKENQDKERLQDFQKVALKNFDPYLVSEGTFDDISFQMIDQELEKQEKSDVEMEVIEVVSPSAEVPEDAAKDTETHQLQSILDNLAPTVPTEKSSMRLSKRLNPGDLAPIYADDIQLIRRYFIETEYFFNHLNDSFKGIFNIDYPVLNDIVSYIVSTESESKEPQYVHDFLKTLNEWKTSSYDPILFPEKNKDNKRKGQSDKIRLIEVLTNFGNQLSDSNKHIPLLDEAESQEFVAHFISEQLSGNMHVNEAKLSILRHLISKITVTVWNEQLLEAVSEWVLQLEPSILETCTRCLDQSCEPLDYKLYAGIYEILVDTYITTKEKLESSLESGAHTHFSKSVKANYNANAFELLRLKARIEKWATVFETALSSTLLSVKGLDSHMELVVRFYWASNYFVAAQSFTWREKKFVVVHLNKLAQLLESLSSKTELLISYPNYKKIGEFSLEGLYRRLSTASILSIFSKILDQSGSETVSTNETISLLESILFEEETMANGEDSREGVNTETKTGSLVTSVINGLAVLDKLSLSSVKEFFYECPVDLKLSLWNILFLYYQKDSFFNFQKGLEHYLLFILEFLRTSPYTSFQGDKNALLLTLLASYRSQLSVLLSYLSEHKWQLPSKSVGVRQLSDFSRIFEICYIFSLHEEAAFYTSRKVSVSTKSEASFEYFKDFFMDSVTILLAYCFNYIMALDTDNKDILVSNFLSLVHHQLGLRHLCDCSKGIFLKFAEDSLVTLSKIPEMDLTQIMACRYHYKVKLYGQFPTDHYTVKSAELNKRSAEELAVFILPLCFQTNPLTHTPRNDLKQVVDDLFEIIGDPDVDSDQALNANMVTIENFISQTSVDARYVKEAFYGLQALELKPPQTPNKVAIKGLYFLEAVLMFNSYKIRKKSAQSRTVELERIITILSYDLMYGSERVESWILLGQAYGYIVEDDLIWTSDKINTIERKIPTANLQRKSLVCYLMAVSLMTRKNSRDMQALKAVTNVLMNSFAKELYSASRNPMNMLAFQVYDRSKFVRKNDQTVFMNMSDKPGISQKFCLALMNKCLDLAVKACPDDWNSLYYSAKVKDKLGVAATEVLDVMARASAAAKIQSISSDPILEPVYKYLSILYKKVKHNQLSVQEGVRYIRMDSSLTTMVECEAKTQKEFFLNIMVCLKKIMLLDKRGWYHKPSYLQAVIAFTEFNNLKEAKDILSKFFTLRSNNKTYLQLWKPENERPGKHFVYMFQYTSFFIMLLSYAQDLTSLLLMCPKLRRANSTITLLLLVWEQLCTAVCTIIRKILNIDSLFVRVFLESLTHATFIVQARKVAELVQTETPSYEMQKFFCLLNVVSDIRKLNNGFGPTALIDYTFAGIFIYIFREHLLTRKDISEMVVPDSPNGKAKKLVKRDLLPFAVDMASKCKRSTEAYLKANPDTLNTYVTNFEREAEIMKQKIVQEETQKLHALNLKFLRLFAEQILLKNQRKAMLEMLHHTIPSEYARSIKSAVIFNSGPNLEITMNMCGPEALAATFNESRRYARVLEMQRATPDPFIQHPLSGTIGEKSSPSETDNQPSAMSNAYQTTDSEVKRISGQPFNSGLGVFRMASVQPKKFEIIQDAYSQTAQTASDATGQVTIPSVQQRFETEYAPFRGTEDDPVEIDSDQGTSVKEKKRILDAEPGEQLTSKRAREQ